MIRIPFLIILALKLSAAAAEIVFEGYYKIEKGEKPLGFSVVREEFDPKLKEWRMHYFINTRDRDHEERSINCSIRYNQNFKPLESTYEETDGALKSSSHILFSGSKFTHKFVSKGTKGTVSGTLGKDEFLRSSAHRVLLHNKLKKGMGYSFTALREDSGKQQSGQVKVHDEKDFGGHKVFQISDDFELYIEETWLTADGQVLSSRTPQFGITSTLVANIDIALEGSDYNRKNLAKMFGQIPLGKKNKVARGLTVSRLSFSEKVSPQLLKLKNPTPVRLPVSK
jgi:hypothetical protein